ncbi:MAG: crotonase/enoyl-CoA hydratase family protein [Xanthomonadaceae bacterium]|nr:crotonase/enoyl-CoA hydratase family protein [Xanthomonadaceae bacterium]
MNSVEHFANNRRYKTIRVESESTGSAHWLFMHSDVGAGIRPCFRRELMEEMWGYLSSISTRSEARLHPRMRHLVIASDSSAYNLGGDLELFSALIKARNRERLLEYARRCVEGVHAIHRGLGGDMRTIALVQGDALGGGMELALSCHTIVAERGACMGLPEVVFGLFPGMGAYSFLCKRVSPQLAEKIILEGKLHPVEALHEMGIVDVLADKGEGVQVVQEIIRQQQRAPHAHLALNAVRSLAQPVGYDELMGITEIWVDSALSLDERSLRTMDRIVKAQHRRTEVASVA